MHVGIDDQRPEGKHVIVELPIVLPPALHLAVAVWPTRNFVFSLSRNVQHKCGFSGIVHPVETVAELVDFDVELSGVFDVDVEPVSEKMSKPFNIKDLS